MDLIRGRTAPPYTGLRRPGGAKIELVTAKERLLREAPAWTDAQATAALRVVAAQEELASYLDHEAKLSAEELDAREDQAAEASAREAIRDEPW
jgi:hypothetical protein